MIHALATFAALCAAPVLLLVAACIVRARDNARHRAVRRRMRAALLDQIHIDHEFEAIVAASYARKDHA